MSKPSEDAQAVHSTSGSVFPAASGVQMVEYDAAGAEIQRASASDSAGVFLFSHAVTGSRVQSSAQGSELRLPVQRSARLRNVNAVIEITPLTTLFDQLVGAGYSESAASDAIHTLTGNACGVDAPVGMDGGLYADTPFTDSSRQWLLRSLGAYLNAFRTIGLSPGTPGLDWAAKLEQRRDLLAQMCSVARTIFSDTWLATTQATIATDLKLAPGASIDGVATLREGAADQVLALLGTQLAALEYPEVSPVVTASSQSWQGKELELAVQLIEAELSPSGSVATTKALDLASQNIVVSHTLDRGGRIVSSLFGVATPSQSQPAVLRFSNQGGADRQVKLIINDASLADFNGVLAQVLATPAVRFDEPLRERAWHFVVSRRRHTAPFTTGSFVNQADLYLRSIGSGYCDDVAAVLYWIWRGLGYEARVMALTGHVVPEVRANGRWEMYDPDLDVYYLDRNGLVANVDELAQDPALITQPVIFINSTDSIAYTPYVADIYSSTADNYVFDDSDPIPQPLTNVFTVPQGGYIEIVGGATYVLPTIDPEMPVSLAPMRVWFPPGYSGPVALPMVLADISGSGSITLLGQQLNVTDSGIASVIEAYYQQAPDVGITGVQIDNVGEGGLTLTMMVNPLYFHPTGPMRAGVYGDDLSGLTVGAVADSR